MTIAEEVKHGVLSIKGLSRLIDDNLRRADDLDISIHYYNDKESKDLVGELKRNGAVIHSRNYQGKYLHTRIANLHADIHYFMRNLEEREKKQREYQARLNAHDNAVRREGNESPWAHKNMNDRQGSPYGLGNK